MNLVVATMVGMLSAQGAMEQTLMSYVPDQIFVPEGFDDNDNVQVVIRGDYPSTCFETGKETIEVDEVKKVIRVDNKAYFKEGDCFCVFMRVPFKKVLNLGHLKAGDYSIQFRDYRPDPQEGYRTMGTLKVLPAGNHGPDDHIYAPVQEAFLVNPQGPAPYKLKLRGTLRNSCLSIQTIEVKEAGKGVVLVRPILSFEDSSQRCEVISEFFEKEIILPKMETSHVLVHIRTVDGQAMNRVVELN